MKGIYTTSISKKILDEAPMAYKSLEDIVEVIEGEFVYETYIFGYRWRSK